jgi:hypothetical protein
MVDEEPPANSSARMDFNACQEAIHMRQETRQKEPVPRPKAVCQPV